MQSTRPYYAFYNGRSILVHATSTRDAQEVAAKVFKPRRIWQITCVLADTAVSTASL